MKFNIAPIKGSPGAKKPIEISTLISDLKTSGSHVPVDSPTNFSGEAESIVGGLVVTGTVTNTWEGECRRCLGKASGDIKVKVRELFEAKSTEGESYPLESDQIDLEPVLIEAVMLELPVAPVCKEDCKGLCPNCGTNWNTSTCKCPTEITDPRWAALDQLKE